MNLRKIFLVVFSAILFSSLATQAEEFKKLSFVTSASAATTNNVPSVPGYSGYALYSVAVLFPSAVTGDVPVAVRYGDRKVTLATLSFPTNASQVSLLTAPVFLGAPGDALVVDTSSIGVSARVIGTVQECTEE